MRKVSFASLLLILITAINVQAQTANEPEMARVMRSNGKIYVVVLVLATIFAGIFAYLVFLTSKITKLEKQNK